MMAESIVSEKLRHVGLRPTRQRLVLGGLLWRGGNRHVTAEQLHTECGEAGSPVSMATVYNTLHQFVSAGLLREVVVDSGSSYFDTNTSPHHHFYFEDTGYLEDIPADKIAIPSVPEPVGKSGRVKSIEVIVRLRSVGHHPASV